MNNINKSKELQMFAQSYWERFNFFREIEVQEITQGPFKYSNEAFALLYDIEHCYAAKAYYACLFLAHTIIETHLRHIAGMKGNASKMFKKAGIYKEIDWLNKLRNDISHGNPNTLIKYGVFGEEEKHLDQLCQKAFKFMHELPVRLQKINENG